MHIHVKNYSLILLCSVIALMASCTPISSNRDGTVQPQIGDNPSGELETQTINKTITSSIFLVSLSIPSTWERVSGYDERFQGEGAFVSLGAKATDTYSTIQAVCDDEINHVLQPFGSTPSVQYLSIDNQEACVIIPSDDQNDTMENAAEILVRYPQPVTINGTLYAYAFLQVYVTKGYTLPIIPTIDFDFSVQ
jgi:hypothetical protein